MKIIQPIKKFYTNYKNRNKNDILNFLKGLYSRGGSETQMGAGGYHVYPKYPYGRHTLYELAYYSDILTILHEALRRELFRNGFDLLESEKSSSQDASDDQEGQGNDTEKEEILKVLGDINNNNQSIIEVYQEIEDDFSIHDDGWMQITFDYFFGSKGEIDKRRFAEALRVSPLFMGKVMNKYDVYGFDDDYQQLNVCPRHRDNLLIGHDVCTRCHGKAYRAYYFFQDGSTKMYYMKDEFVHKSKYRPSKRLGQSPILAMWTKVRTLLYMDYFMMETFEGKRPPKGLLAFNTTNEAGLKRAWEGMLKRAEENPNLPSIMGVPGDASGKSFVEFIDFMKTNEEFQYIEVRNEMRTQAGMIYGVEPIYQGDLSGGGGLNNEGLQVTVTNRAMQSGQTIYDDFYSPKLIEAMGYKGWTLRLNPSEEQDEAAELERQSKSLANGKLAVTMGLKAEYIEEEDKVKIYDGELEKPENPFEQGGNGEEGEEQPQDAEDGNEGEPDTDFDFLGPEKSLTKKKN